MTLVEVVAFVCGQRGVDLTASNQLRSFSKGSQDIIGERDFVPSPARRDFVHSLNKEWDFVSHRFS